MQYLLGEESPSVNQLDVFGLQTRLSWRNVLVSSKDRRGDSGGVSCGRAESGTNGQIGRRGKGSGKASVSRCSVPGQGADDSRISLGASDDHVQVKEGNLRSGASGVLLDATGVRLYSL